MDREPVAGRRLANHARERPDVELVFVDGEVLDDLVTVATTDAAPDEVTPPLSEGWTPGRVEWLRAFHRQRRTGLAGGNEETAAIRVGDRIVGAVRLHRSAPESPDALEYGIWLAASWRGRGLSSTVLRLVADRAAVIGASRLTARTTSGNAPAIATLRRAGAIIRHGDDDSVHAVILLHGGSPDAAGDEPRAAAPRAANGHQAVELSLAAPGAATWSSVGGRCPPMGCRGIADRSIRGMRSSPSLESSESSKETPWLLPVHHPPRIDA